MSENNVITNEELQRLIQADRAERARAALADIQQVLKQHNCTLHVFIEIALDGTVMPGYKVVPL